MTGRLKNLTVNTDQSQDITITVTSDCRELYDKLKENEITFEMKKASKHRSMDANNYLWALCSEIAKATSKYSTDGKNEIYREAIRAKGEYIPLLIKEEAVEKFITRWSEKGTGWFAEVIDDFDFNGHPRKVIHAYYGSSTYDSLSMSHIIDYVVHIANDLSIPTMTPNETRKMLDLWQKKVSK